MTFCRASPNEPPVRAIKSAAFIRLLVADANAMVCELLTQAFHRRRMFEVSGCATTTAQVLSVISSAAIDVALVGAHPSGVEGAGLRLSGRCGCTVRILEGSFCWTVRKAIWWLNHSERELKGFSADRKIVSRHSLPALHTFMPAKFGPPALS